MHQCINEEDKCYYRPKPKGFQPFNLLNPCHTVFPMNKIWAKKGEGVLVPLCHPSFSLRLSASVYLSFRWRCTDCTFEHTSPWRPPGMLRPPSMRGHFRIFESLVMAAWWPFWTLFHCGDTWDQGDEKEEVEEEAWLAQTSEVQPEVSLARWHFPRSCKGRVPRMRGKGKRGRVKGGASASWPPSRTHSQCSARRGTFTQADRSPCTDMPAAGITQESTCRYPSVSCRMW